MKKKVVVYADETLCGTVSSDMADDVRRYCENNKITVEAFVADAIAWYMRDINAEEAKRDWA